MTSAAAMSVEEERLRPLYARVLRLRHVDPGGTLCFVYFEGTVALGLLLALAELVSWWGVLVLPATVAVMVKVNDVVAAAVVRSAARVPAQERERFRREIQPAVGRARVPGRLTPESGRAVPLTGVAPAAGDAAGPASGTSDPAPSTRHDPATRPAGMSAAVWARLERGGRWRYRPNQDLPPRPTVDILDRSGSQGTGTGPPRTSDASGSPGGSPTSPAVPFRPSPTPVPGRAAERRGSGAAERSTADECATAGAADRPNVGEAAAVHRPNVGDPTAVRKSGAGRAQTAAGRGQHPTGQQQIDSLPGAGGGRSLNRGLSERLDQRPVRRWLVRLDPTDAVRQRGRQSAKRRYE